MLEDPFDELGPESCQSIFVGHHNLFDCSCLDTLQKPREALPFVLEATADVTELLVRRVLFAEGVDLSLQIFLLFRGRDTTVDGSDD